MPSTLPNLLPDPRPFLLLPPPIIIINPLQPLKQHLTMRHRNQIILRAMHDLYALSANLVSNFGKLRGRFMVVCCGEGLENEAFARETIYVRAFCQFLRSEAVAFFGGGG